MEFCRRIRNKLRRSDHFGRWGGEEFLILLPHSDGRAGYVLAEQLRQLIVETAFVSVGQVSASFGVAQRRRHEPEPEWVRRVDDMLYAAKQGGRNQVTLASG